MQLLLEILGVLALFTIPFVVPLMWSRQHNQELYHGGTKRQKRKRLNQEIKAYRSWRIVQVTYLLLSIVVVIRAFGAEGYSDSLWPFVSAGLALLCYPLARRLYIYVTFGSIKSIDQERPGVIS